MTNKRCLIYETLGKITNLQVSESAAPQGMMRLEGVFGVCGIKNQNNRIYDKENYAKMVEALQEVIKRDNGCPGELEHPNSMNICLENVSHKIESIQMNEDGTITGTILLLNTPKGQIAQAIVEGGLPLYISSRGAGTITNESGISHVTLSTIKTYDLVGTPGFSQAKLNLLKSNQTLECLNESADDGNIMYAIVEGDDLLGDDDDNDDKKDDKKDQPKDDKKDEPKDDKKDEPKDDKKDEPKDDKKDAPKDDKKDDDNKNNDNKDINMKELKEAIDKLSEKVTSLEAELHVAQESLDETKSIKPTNYEGIQKWITEEFAPEFKKQINESMETTSLDEIMENVKDWLINEFAPQVQSWVTEEFAPEVQNWVIEEFAPEVQNWITEEYSPEIQDWVVEEFAPEVQNWITEEYSPEIQGWITEEFAPTMENWLMEEYTPEQSAIIENKVNENVSAFMESQKAGRLDEIDSLLESIAADDNSDVQNIVKEQQIENKFKGIYVVENMPAEYVPSWQLLDEARQNEIIRTSKMYDFTKEGVLESFWANVDFNKKSDTKQINENNNPVDNYQFNIIAKMKKLRGLNV